MSSYPVAYRPQVNLSPVSNGPAFKAPLTDFDRLLQSDFQRLMDMKARVNQAKLKDISRTFPKPYREFGRRTAAELVEQLLREQLRQKARTMIVRAVPIIGELLIAKDVYDLVGEVVSTVTTYPDAHYEPGPPIPAGWVFPGWYTATFEQPYSQYPGQPDGENHWDPSGGVRVDMSPVVGTFGLGFHLPEPAPETQAADARSAAAVVPGVLTEYDGDVSPLSEVTVQIWERPQDGVDPRYQPATSPEVYVPGDPVTETVTSPLFEGGADTVTIGDGLPSQTERGQGRRPVLAVDTTPSSQPTVVTIVAPNGAGSVIGNHNYEDNGKEQKKSMPASVAKVIGKIAEGTEYDDAISAFWDTLPDSKKTGYYKIHKKGGKEIWVKRREPTPQQKTKDVYRHWADVDIKESFVNLAKNQVEDLLIGLANKAVAKQAKRWYNESGRPVGFSTGPAL